MSRYKNFLFDLDGTLIDSSLGIQSSFDFAYKKIYDLENQVDIKSFIGPPIGYILSSSFGEKNEATVNRFVGAFKDHYDAYGYQKSVLFANVINTLSELKKNEKKLFIATNKRFTPTKLILKYINILSFFDDVYCIDSHKNMNSDKTIMLKNLSNEHTLDLNETIMIGDTEHDAVAAKNNNIKFAWVNYGYGKCEFYDYLLTDIKDILTLYNK